MINCADIKYMRLKYLSMVLLTAACSSDPSTGFGWEPPPAPDAGQLDGAKPDTGSATDVLAADTGGESDAGAAGDTAPEGDAGTAGDGAPAGDAGDSGGSDAGPACMPACAPGAKRCGPFGLPQVCAYVDNCLQWTAAGECSAPETCRDGICQCPAICTVGHISCGGKDIMVCQEVNGCPAWTVKEACPALTRCGPSPTGGLSCNCSGGNCCESDAQCGSCRQCVNKQCVPRPAGTTGTCAGPCDACDGMGSCQARAQVTCYRDNDGDGYGNSNSRLLACIDSSGKCPAGWTRDMIDCCDDDPAKH